MMESRTGVVVGKDFRPPEGERVEDWCYLIVDLSNDERVSLRVGRDQIGMASLGDSIRFAVAEGPDLPVRDLVLI